MLEQSPYETIVKRLEVEVSAAAFKASNPPLEEELVAMTLKHIIQDEEMIDMRKLCRKYLYDTLFAPENIKLENIVEDFEEVIAHKPSFLGCLAEGDQKVTLKTFFSKIE